MVHYGTCGAYDALWYILVHCGMLWYIIKIQDRSPLKHLWPIVGLVLLQVCQQSVTNLHVRDADNNVLFLKQSYQILLFKTIPNIRLKKEVNNQKVYLTPWLVAGG